MIIATVMPVRNCLRYSQLAVASVYPQERHWLGPLYFIDNESTDGTAEWAKTQPLRYMPQERNIGVAAAWNLGIRTAFEEGASRVLVVNNDIVFGSDTFLTLDHWMAIYRDKALLTAHAVAGAPEWLDDMPKDCQVEEGEAEFSAFMITPAIVDAVGWFDEQFSPAYFEDKDYEMRMKEAGIVYGRAMDAHMCHFHSRTMHEGMTPGLDKAFIANRERFVAKWRHKLERLP